MIGDFIFSWAENAEGRMVPVDSVPRGLRCGCTCPNCHEPLLARHGEKNEHGFAHHSDTRGANLNICYMVILYKLAEQIIQTKKRIHAPSYYAIFPEKDIDFVEVKVAKTEHVRSPVARKVFLMAKSHRKRSIAVQRGKNESLLSNDLRPKNGACPFTFSMKRQCASRKRSIAVHYSALSYVICM